MALYKKSEFAKKCGKEPAYISVNISREKIIVREDGMIDDSVFKNKLFLEECLAKAADKLLKADNPADESVLSENIPEGKAKRSANPADSVSSEHVAASISLDRQKKISEIEWKDAQTRKLKIEEAKLRGENIPTKIVYGIVGMLGKSFQSSYRDGAAVLLTEIAHKLKMSPEIEAEFKTRFVEIINDSHKHAITEVKKGIEAIISEVATDDLLDGGPEESDQTEIDFETEVSTDEQ
jgi:hypothetical protein